MGGDIECGNCDVCKKQNVVGIQRTYFRYEEIKCECHGNCHFELVYHCPTCVPTEPVETKLVITTANLNALEKRLKQNDRKNIWGLFKATLKLR